MGLSSISYLLIISLYFDNHCDLHFHNRQICHIIHNIGHNNHNNIIGHNDDIGHNDNIGHNDHNVNIDYNNDIGH